MSKPQKRDKTRTRRGEHYVSVLLGAGRRASGAGEVGGVAGPRWGSVVAGAWVAREPRGRSEAGRDAIAASRGRVVVVDGRVSLRGSHVARCLSRC